MTAAAQPRRDGFILYVDDERANRVVFEQSFGARFTVRAVGSGAAALAVLEEQQAAVLITDQRMPEMSGHQLLVRAKALYPETVRVVITAHSDVEPILAAVNEGLVARYIIKPWDRKELEALLEWALAGFRLGREDSALQMRLIETERLASLGTMAAAMLHDLSQPLNNLSVNADRMTELVGGARAEEALELAELSEIAHDQLTSCAMMRDLIQQLRRFLHAEPRADAQQAAELLPVIRYAFNVCRETALHARGRLLYEGPSEPPRVRVSSTALTQILINLVANAAQALERRAAGDGRVVVSVAVDGAQVRLVVRDDGPGMAPELLAKVGRPFFSTRPDGTGLGVSQCYRLVAAAGGSFALASREGVGTTATVTLPLA